MEINQSDLSTLDFAAESNRDDFTNDDHRRIQSVADESNVECENFEYVEVLCDVKPHLNSIPNPEDPERRSLYSDALRCETHDDANNGSCDRVEDVDSESPSPYNLEAGASADEIMKKSSRDATVTSKYETHGSRLVAKTNETIVTTAKLKTWKRKSSNRAEESKDDSASNDRNDRTTRSDKSEKKMVDRTNGERLWKKSVRKTEKRKKYHETESDDRRLERLAREAAKRREMRMYYETPEHRRKRLDAEAARKREHRLYNETADERRKRLDREAERRREKRLSIYDNETDEQRRERLNRESTKRRESRLNQYARENDDEKRERLEKDATRAREMRFTRSTVETTDERRCRLVKDAMRKRELRINGDSSIYRFGELKAVGNFDDANNDSSASKVDDDDRADGHYLTNWMLWFQNTLTQNVDNGDKS